ncbi:Frizzy aggregation protein FrzB [Myxococcus stipitatus]|uniref:Frizzy aggregation protein FrzB n=1 Tax=Myxococcus stipitatus TaxID=83455 RepID=UPI0030D3CF37
MNDESLGIEETFEEVDILFFEVGGGVFGADASQVLRIDRSLPEDITLPELGRLHRGNRALVFDTPEGEGHLKVDAVTGVRSIPVTQLRRMPPTAGAAPYAVGVCLEEARTVLLIDLVQTARPQGTQGRH